MMTNVGLQPAYVEARIITDDKYNLTMQKNGFYIHMGGGKRRGWEGESSTTNGQSGYVMVYKTC